MRSTKQVKYIEFEDQPIVLIGFMGCGKSTLGRSLARALKRDFIDLDQQIVKKAGCTVAEIFRNQGEKAFRAHETRILKTALKARSVVALGGGTATLGVNRKIISQARARIVWIDPSWRALWKRLGLMRARTRPLLWDDSKGHPKSQQAIKALWSARRAIYRQIADVHVRVQKTSTEKQTLIDLIDSMGRER